MSDKIKEIRNANPMLDFAAGFIPGVGEALDAHDFYHAAKKKDFGGMALASLGFLLPFVSGSQINKIAKRFLGDVGELSPALKSKGWKVSEDGKAFIHPNGTRYRKFKETPLDPGKLMSEETIGGKIKDTLSRENRDKALKAVDSAIKKFNKEAEEFADKTGFFFDTHSWQAGIPKGMQLNAALLNDYVSQTGKTIMRHFDVLMENGKKAIPNTYALRGTKGNYEAWFPESLPLKGKYGEKYKAGWRKVTNLEAELYLIQTSPNAIGKFEITGIPMYRGIKPEMFLDFQRGAPQQWYSSNVAGALTYSGPKGMRFFAAPVKTSKTKVVPITNAKSKPSSTSWHASGRDPINGYISGDSHAINISEVPLEDSMSKASGFFTVLGPDTQIKVLKGGTGWFDLSKSNPLLQLAIPVGIGSAVGIPTLINHEQTDKK